MAWRAKVAASYSDRYYRLPSLKDFWTLFSQGDPVLTSIVGMIVLLGGLIFFHEFGHYSVAKLFGVKVEVFSLGFGKKIFRKQIGETEYTLSLFPLGGYVKLMGDDPYKGVPAA